jgi:hypothetical protein
MFLFKLIQALDKYQIDYAIVGGYAVALHGAIRGTVDLDLVICFSEKDFVTLEKALKSLGLEPRLPVDGKQVFKFRKEYIENKNLIAWSFYNPLKPIEVVDIIITHDRRKMKVKTISMQGINVKVASVPDLIRMKTLSGRPQDLADIEALRRLEK